MINVKEEVKSRLKAEYEQSCDGYLRELLRMWDLDSYYGYWIGDEVGGVYDYADGSIDIGMADIIYCVENDVTREQFDEWSEYICDASEFGFETPNLRSWMHGCPRVSQETFDKLRTMKQELNKEIEETKKRYKEL